MKMYSQYNLKYICNKLILNYFVPLRLMRRQPFRLIKNVHYRICPRTNCISLLTPSCVTFLSSHLPWIVIIVSHYRQHKQHFAPAPAFTLQMCCFHMVMQLIVMQMLASRQIPRFIGSRDRRLYSLRDRLQSLNSVDPWIA